ncbi:hypothetical protein ACHAXS_006150 [Conticribra weissflogii]
MKKSRIHSPSHSVYGYQITTLQEWMSGFPARNIESPVEDPVSTHSILPLVDLRDCRDFQRCRLSSQSSSSANPTYKSTATAPTASIEETEDVPIVNLPLATLTSGERSCELPPRHFQFAILVPRQFIHFFDSAAIHTSKNTGDHESTKQTQHFGIHDSSSDGIKHGKDHFLEESSIHQLFFASQSKSTSQSRKPWLVKQVLLEDDNIWSEARHLGVLVEGGGSCEANTGRNHHFPFRSLPRLWKPDPLVCSKILPLLRERVGEYSSIQSSNDNENVSSGQIPTRLSRGMVLDLGSGAGRDICYLAEELKQYQHSCIVSRQCQHDQPHPTQQPLLPPFPLHFVGIDNHKGSSKRCLPLWKNRGVEDLTGTCCLDLNKLHHVRKYFTDFDSSFRAQSSPNRDKTNNLENAHFIPEIVCLYAIRFLNRKLFSYIANSSSSSPSSEKNDSFLQPTPPDKSSREPTLPDLPPTKRQKKLEDPTTTPPLFLPIGTIFAISHFCKPREGAEWNFDHPKESSVLERRELKKLFGGAVRESIAGNGSIDEKNDQRELDISNRSGIGYATKKWEILHDDICFDGDHGRTLIQFVARKIS